MKKKPAKSIPAIKSGDDFESLGMLYRTVWSLAWPVIISQSIGSVVMFVTRVLISHLGEKAYNSVSIGTMVFMLIITILASVSVGTTALVAQSWGAGDKKHAGRILQQSLIWGISLTILIALAGMPASRVLYKALGADEATVKLGTEFLMWLFTMLPFIVPGIFLAAGLRAVGDTRTPLIAMLITGMLSLFLSYGLILGKLGMPKLGTVGAALAAGISFMSATFFLGIFFIINKTRIKLPLRGWRFNPSIGKTILKIGIPSAMEWIIIQIGMLAYVSVIYKYGDEPVAGYFVGVAILAFAQAPGLGFQTAAATLVGQAIGARNDKQAGRIFTHNAVLSFFVMGLAGIIIYTVTTPAFLSVLFGKLNNTTIQYARTFITLLVLVMPLMGVSFSMAGGLRGAGKTIHPLIASTVGVYGGRILLAFAMYIVFHPPVVFIWCSMFPDLILRIAVMGFRIRSGTWKDAVV